VCGVACRASGGKAIYCNDAWPQSGARIFENLTKSCLKLPSQHMKRIMGNLVANRQNCWLEPLLKLVGQWCDVICLRHDIRISGYSHMTCTTNIKSIHTKALVAFDVGVIGFACSYQKSDARCRRSARCFSVARLSRPGSKSCSMSVALQRPLSAVFECMKLMSRNSCRLRSG